MLRLHFLQSACEDCISHKYDDVVMSVEYERTMLTEHAKLKRIFFGKIRLEKIGFIMSLLDL